MIQLIIIIAVVVIVFIATRSINLWYLKINDILNNQKEILKLLNNEK